MGSKEGEKGSMMDTATKQTQADMLAPAFLIVVKEWLKRSEQDWRAKIGKGCAKIVEGCAKIGKGCDQLPGFSINCNNIHFHYIYLNTLTQSVHIDFLKKSLLSIRSRKNTRRYICLYAFAFFEGQKNFAI